MLQLVYLTLVSGIVHYDSLCWNEGHVWHSKRRSDQMKKKNLIFHTWQSDNSWKVSVHLTLIVGYLVIFTFQIYCEVKYEKGKRDLNCYYRWCIILSNMYDSLVAHWMPTTLHSTFLLSVVKFKYDTFLLFLL